MLIIENFCKSKVLFSFSRRAFIKTGSAIQYKYKYKPNLPPFGLGKWRQNSWLKLIGASELYIYIWSEIFRLPSEVKYGAMEALSYDGFSPPTRSFMFTCFV